MFTGSLFKSRSRRRSQQQRNKSTRFNLACESLEGRQLLSGTPQILSFGSVYDSLTYGTTLGSAINPPPIQDANGHAVPGTFDFKNGPDDVTDTVLDVGHHDLSVTFIPDDTIDYSSVTTTASIDITKAKIAIVANSYEKTYGSSNPTLTDTIYADLGPFTDPGTGQTGEAYTQLGPDDLASVAYSNALGNAAAASTDANLLAIAGNHDINPTQISDGGAGTASHEFLNNFDVTYEGGTLTVSPKALTITANDATKTYGDAVTFAGTEFTTNGLVNGDSVERRGLDQRRRGGDGEGLRLALCHRGEQRDRQRPGQLHDPLRQWQPDRRPGPAHGHGQRRDQDLRRRGDLRRDRVHDQRPGQRRQRRAT